MKDGSRIYEHTDGRWEARYRKGRKPDGSIIYGSVYGRTYEEAEKRRAEILRALAVKAENGESENAVQLFEENRNIRSYYAVTHRNKTVYPGALSEDEVQELIPYIKMCHVGLRLATCFALYMGVSGDEIAALRFSDIDAQTAKITISHVMMDAKHMPGMIVSCEERIVPIPKVVSEYVNLAYAVQSGEDRYLLTEKSVQIKSMRTARILWSRAFSAFGYEKKITPEVLRATFIRRCLENGMNFETVSFMTGLGVSVIRNKYGHFAEANPALIDALNVPSNGPNAKTKQMNLLILGAGSHGHAVYEIADKLGIFQKIRFLDDTVIDSNVIGRISDYPNFADEYPMCFIAIGNNMLRRQLAEKVTEAGYITPHLISNETSIARGVSIGRGTIVMPQATINTGAEIGDFCIIASNSMIGFNATVESFAHCDCASVVMKDCTVPGLTTVESGEIVKDTQKIS